MGYTPSMLESSLKTAFKWKNAGEVGERSSAIILAEAVLDMRAQLVEANARVSFYRDREPLVRELWEWASQAIEHMVEANDVGTEDYIVAHHIVDAIAAVRNFDLKGKPDGT